MDHFMINSIILMIYYGANCVSSTVLHPASSSISVISSVSIPIPDLSMERRTLFDWCFQMSYDLPSKVSSLYNTQIWPVHMDRSKRNSFITNHTESTKWLKALKYGGSGRQHFSDFSAGELYQTLEDLLMSFGYHETCLLRTVCELARHPFDDQHRNILTDTLTFIFSPSIHKAFTEDELLYKDLYEGAELRGFLQEDCENIYNQCASSILDSITIILRH